MVITADLLDPGRVNLFERWESQAAVETFRRSAPATSTARQCSRCR
jgi:quinol monooxygenase YgiN